MLEILKEFAFTNIFILIGLLVARELLVGHVNRIAAQLRSWLGFAISLSLITFIVSMATNTL